MIGLNLFFPKNHRDSNLFPFFFLSKYFPIPSFSEENEGKIKNNKNYTVIVIFRIFSQKRTKY